MQYLMKYRWTSLKGYIDKGGKESFIDYSMVLGEYGGDTDKGREAYKKRIEEDIRAGLEIKDKVIGQSILGGEKFIEWIKEIFLKGLKSRRELPAVKELQR